MHVGSREKPGTRAGKHTRGERGVREKKKKGVVAPRAKSARGRFTGELRISIVLLSCAQVRSPIASAALIDDPEVKTPPKTQTPARKQEDDE